MAEVRGDGLGSGVHCCTSRKDVKEGLIAESPVRYICVGANPRERHASSCCFMTEDAGVERVRLWCTPSPGFLYYETLPYMCGQARVIGCGLGVCPLCPS